jgi:hypothetical protein
VRSRNYRCGGKAISITYSECVFVALGIRCGKPVRLYNIFPTLSHKRQDFRKQNYLTQNICFNFLYNFLSETFLILKRIQRDIIKNVHISVFM